MPSSFVFCICSVTGRPRLLTMARFSLVSLAPVLKHSRQTVDWFDWLKRLNCRGCLVDVKKRASLARQTSAVRMPARVRVKCDFQRVTRRATMMLTDDDGAWRHAARRVAVATAIYWIYTSLRARPDLSVLLVVFKHLLHGLSYGDHRVDCDSFPVWLCQVPGCSVFTIASLQANQ